MKREDLLKAIEQVMPGIDKPGSPLGMDFVVLNQGYLLSFNDVISVAISVQDLAPELKGAIKAQELYKVLSKMEGDQIRLSSTEKELIVKNPKTTLKMTFMEEKQLGVLYERLTALNRDQLVWTKIPSKFMDGLELCAPNVRNDPTLGVLAGVAVNGQYMASTDNKRISLFHLSEEIKDGFILPAEVIRDVIRYGRKSDKISITDNWIHFSNKEGLIISTRKLMGDYPIEKVIEIIKTNDPDPKLEPYILPKGLEKALDRAEVLAQEEEEYHISMVTLKRKGDFLIVTSGQQVGQIEDRLVWESGSMPEEIEIVISPDFLKKILRITRGFSISPNRNCILFSSPGFQHLMVAKVS